MVRACSRLLTARQESTAYQAQRAGSSRRREDQESVNGLVQADSTVVGLGGLPVAVRVKEADVIGRYNEGGSIRQLAAYNSNITFHRTTMFWALVILTPLLRPASQKGRFGFRATTAPRLHPS
jgi:hypothetical protein